MKPAVFCKFMFDVFTSLFGRAIVSVGQAGYGALCTLAVIVATFTASSGQADQPTADSHREVSATVEASDFLSPLDQFRDPKDGWIVCGNVALDKQNPKKLVFEPGKGVILSQGEGKDLVTKKTYRDCRVELEFMIPKGSNAGVKLAGCYEIQILDSYGKTKLTGSDCGGIYPRAELRPRYRTIDEGFPPKVNACREPGAWQTLEIVFRAPQFDTAGKKTSNARFELVKLNGQTVHENQEVPYPTGHVWRSAEKPEGPILLQGDHGPVAFRKLRITSIDR